MMASLEDTPLMRDFPQAAMLSRSDLQSLAGSGASSATTARTPDLTAGTHLDAAQMNEDDLYFEAYFNSLPQVQKLMDEHQRLLQENEDLAKRNNELRPALEALRAETTEHYTRARQLEEEWPSIEVEMSEALKRFSPAALQALLSHRVARLHDQSESLANAFVEGLPFSVAQTDSSAASPVANGAAEAEDRSVAFIRRYRTLRNQYHRRNIVVERWAAGGVGGWEESRG